MLVLSRKKNEAIHVGNDGIVITVVDIRGQQVRLGIEAPSDVPIRRKEIIQRDVPEHLLVSIESLARIAFAAWQPRQLLKPLSKARSSHYRSPRRSAALRFAAGLFGYFRFGKTVTDAAHRLDQPGVVFQLRS